MTLEDLKGKGGGKIWRFNDDKKALKYIHHLGLSETWINFTVMKLSAFTSLCV